MPAVSPSKYRVDAGKGAHWHRPDRTKACIRCGEEKPLGEFYSYGYTTRQGKPSTRYESRCAPCARERRVEGYNPERERPLMAAWHERNREHRATYSRKRQADPAHRANKAKAQRLRKARIRSGEGDTPAIRALYAQALHEERLIQPCPLFDLPELGKKLHVDHVHPLSKGGRHVIENLQILPVGLNLRKGAKCPL